MNFSEQLLYTKKILFYNKISMRNIFSFLIPYFIFTILSTFLEGVTLLLFIQFFTKSSNELIPLFLRNYFTQFDINNKNSIILLIIFLLLTIILKFTLTYCEGNISAKLRRIIQKNIYDKLLNGDWLEVKTISVGDAIGTITQESTIVAKYLISIVNFFYFFIGALIMVLFTLSINYKITLILGILILPIILLMKIVFKLQSNYSADSAISRNLLSSDITERLNGLLQVHVGNNENFHLLKGLKNQNHLTKLEINIAYCQAFIGSFTFLLPLLIISFYLVFITFFSYIKLPDTTLFASIGALSLRVATQFNGAIASIGNLTRLSGSLLPVLKSLQIPKKKVRSLITHDLTQVKIDNISFSFNSQNVINNFSHIIDKGCPLVLSGRSGKGKTTLANIIAGLYFPEKGNVYYISSDLTHYNSKDYKIKIGYVTQDIFLFKGTIKENLVEDNIVNEKKIWEVLSQVDATDFVINLGGLNAESLEAGKSLSGGQKRRLGIAKVLLSSVDILIFDEVTAGLDDKNKLSVLNIIKTLSKENIVIIISHDPVDYEIQDSIIL
jgi:ATP-binding cassette subfamily C protein